jgi:hypothetical protein
MAHNNSLFNGFGAIKSRPAYRLQSPILGYFSIKKYDEFGGFTRDRKY